MNDCSSELDPLVQRFRQPDLRRVLNRLVDRLRQGKPLTGRLRLRDPSDAERRAVAGLTGVAGRGRVVSVDLDALATMATRDGRFRSLQQLVEAAFGQPIADRRARRSAERETWDRLWRDMHKRCRDSAALSHWLQTLNSSGWIRKRSGRDPSVARRLLEDAFGVLDRLPLESPLPLAQLAAQTSGDSHGLDPDTDLGRLVLRGAAATIGVESPRHAAAVRAAWSAVGVVCDELSATVLVLNLPAQTGTPLGDVLALHRSLGEPCRVTFRQLRKLPRCIFHAANVDPWYVCENPSVVAAAAERWGQVCRPLLCVEGQPNLAAEELLRQLHDQAFTIHYHGDFDWGGLRIASRLWNLFQFQPWHYCADDYLAAPPGRPLKGTPADAPWDSKLRTAMEEQGTVVHEEAVVHRLLDDLGSRQLSGG